MTRKTIKDLEKEITTLKDGFNDFKNNYDTLFVKHEASENKYNQSISKSKFIFNCNCCDQKFENQ